MKAKKITALLMAAVMTVSLAACGSSGRHNGGACGRQQHGSKG